MTLTPYDLIRKRNAAVDAHRAGDLRRAEQLYRECVDSGSNEIEVLRGLATVLANRQAWAEAQSVVARWIRQAPRDVAAHFLAGEAARFGGDAERAEQSYRTAIKLDPRFAPAHGNLGVLLESLARYDEAAHSYEQILAVDPQSSQAMFNLGRLAKRKGDLARAERLFQEVLRLDPRSGEGHVELARIASDRGEDGAALAHLRSAVACDPRQMLWWEQLGIVAHAEGALDEARSAFLNAIALGPDLASAWSNLAMVFGELGEQASALECYRQAILLAPGLMVAVSNLLLNLNYGHFLDQEQVASTHFALGARYLANVKRHEQRSPGARVSQKRLRVGYVSGDFKQHSVAYFMEPILAHHDRTQIEIFCYADVRRPDAVTARLQRHADHWRDISGLSDERVADLISADGIDILVDLEGHTKGGGHLGVFAHQCAPIQVSYLGYPNTTGLPTIQYRLTDVYADPVGMTERFFTEQLVRLPRPFLCYQPPEGAPEPASMEAGPITFGSFNVLAKLTHEAIEVWSRILAVVPDARLMLKTRGFENEHARERVYRAFEQHGIVRDRVALVPWMKTTHSHLEGYHQIDIALDTFPYNGTTTTCEALWMGVPVVTLAGNVHAARVGVTLLDACELGDLIAATTDAYVDIAVKLANDRERLKNLRAQLRKRMQRSRLLDAPDMAHAVEAAYRQMWVTWCNENGRAQPSVESNREKPAPSAIEQPWYVRILGGIEVCTPASIHFPSTYILLEQENWMENEIDFLRCLLKPRMKAIDVRANHGIYALTMASCVGPDGRVWAFEPVVEDGAFFEQSIARNRLENLTFEPMALSQDVEQATSAAVASLDEMSVRQGWGGVEFLRLHSDGDELDIATGGAAFFASQSPLVMFRARQNEDVNTPLFDFFGRLGYRFLRLIPVLNVLEPIDPTQALEPYQINVFCCKDDRLQWLVERGLAVVTHELSHATEEAGWPSCLGEFPYAQHLHAQWRENMSASPLPAASDYAGGLADYARSRGEQPIAAVRLAHLKRSFERVTAAFDHYSTAPRLMTIARIATDLGYRAMAVQALQQLLEHFSATTDHWHLEPFLPPVDTERLAPQGNILPWLHAGLIAMLERLQAFSSVYTGRASLPNLEQVAQSGYVLPEMERRRQLIRMRYGEQIFPSPTPVLIGASSASLNPAFWRAEWFVFHEQRTPASQ